MFNQGLYAGSRETYNPQIHTEELSLTSQSNKDFAVHNKVLSRFERYTKFTSFLFHTGRVDGGLRTADKLIKSASKEVHDNAYRVKFKSLNIKPAVSMGAVVIGSWHDESNPNPDMSAVAGVTYTGGLNATNVTMNTMASVAIKHDPANETYGDKFNPQDTFSLDAGLGTTFYIQRIRKSSTGTHFILDCVIIGEPADFKEEELNEDEVLMESGNYYGEGSMRGYQRYDQSYWKIFYSFISRYTLTFTGNALDQREVVWNSPSNQSSAMKGRNGDGLWQFKQEALADEMFGIMLELACRFAPNTMDPSSHAWFENYGKNLLSMANLNPEVGVTPPKMSAGWARQIKGTIDLSYDVNAGPNAGGFSAYMLEAVSDVLCSNSPKGQSGNTFVVLGDNVAHTVWDREMKKLMGWNVTNGGAIGGGHNTNIVMDVNSGAGVKLGFGVTSYVYKQNEFIFILDELMSHPGLMNKNGGLVGRGDMYILNVSTFDGVSNFELFTRGEGRFFKKKYVNGLHSLSPEGNNSAFAASGFDGAQLHYLSELFPVCYVEDTCAVIRGRGKYNGGGLAGNTAINDFPRIR